MPGRSPLILASLCLAALAVSCSSPSPQSAYSHSLNLPPPPGVHSPVTTDASATASPRLPLLSSGPLPLELAQQAVRERHPDLVAAWHKLQVQEALHRQAGRTTNPVLFGELEEFAGSQAYRGLDNAAARVGLSREIQTGGKLTKAVQLATVEVQEAICTYRALQTELDLDVEKRFYTVYFLQLDWALKQERLLLLEQTESIIQNRVDAGESNSREYLKNQTERRSAVLDLERTRRALDEARATLAAAWGDQQLHAPAVSASLHQLPAFSLDLLLDRLSHTPAWQKNRLALARATAEIALAESHASPNIELEGGILHSRENDSWALFAGISVPLPLFDRNQDAIAAARARFLQVQAETNAIELELQHTLRSAWHRWQGAQAALTTLNNDIIPAAQRYHDAVNAAWQTGESDILDLVDARHTWLQQKQERLQLQEECEMTRLELMHSIALVNLNELNPEKE